MTDRTVLWRRLDQFAIERVDLDRPVFGGWRFVGHADLVHERAPVLIRYVLICDDDWSTRYVGVESVSAPTTRFVQLLVTGDGQWQARTLSSPLAVNTADFHELPKLAGVRDVAFGFSPLTNALPLRRLRPRVGRAIELTVAWLRFPELTVEPLRQRYTRLGEHRYRCESATGFAAEFEVDEVGLVTAYGQMWERVAWTAAENPERQAPADRDDDFR